MLDFYDIFMNIKGKADKKYIHENAIWHKVVTGIVYNKSINTIYFQTIYPKESYGFSRPDYIDFSVGGHIEEGETPTTALRREALEEIGYIVEESIFLGIRRIIANPAENYKIREFQYLYYLPYKEIDCTKMDKEVKSVIEVNVDDLISLLDKHDKQIEAKETILDKDTRNVVNINAIKLSIDRIIPDYVKDSFFINLLYTLKSM